jgi:hypothetical protein
METTPLLAKVFKVQTYICSGLRVFVQLSCGVHDTSAVTLANSCGFSSLSPLSLIGIPAAAPKGQGNFGAEGNPQVVQGTTHQHAKFALNSLPFLYFIFLSCFILKQD